MVVTTGFNDGTAGLTAAMGNMLPKLTGPLGLLGNGMQSRRVPGQVAKELMASTPEAHRLRSSIATSEGG